MMGSVSWVRMGVQLLKFFAEAMGSEARGNTQKENGFCSI